MQSPRQTCVILSSQILPVDATNYHILPWSFSSRCTPLQRAAPLQSRPTPVFLLRPSVLGSLFSFLSSIGTAASLCQSFPDIHSAVELRVLPNCRGHFLFRHILSPAVVTMPTKVDRVQAATIFHQNECNIKNLNLSLSHMCLTLRVRATQPSRSPHSERNPISSKLLSLSTSMSWQDTYSCVPADSYRITVILCLRGPNEKIKSKCKEPA